MSISKKNRTIWFAKIVIDKLFICTNIFLNVCLNPANYFLRNLYSVLDQWRAKRWTSGGCETIRKWKLEFNFPPICYGRSHYYVYKVYSFATNCEQRFGKVSEFYKSLAFKNVIVIYQIVIRQGASIFDRSGVSSS